MTRPPKIVLTPEQEAYLRSEHAKGVTYKLIAKAMGLSRASFARRVLALGLQRSSAERFRQQRARAIEKRPRKRPPRAARPPIERPPRPPQPHPGSVTLFELAENECRWPNGEWPPYLFCGAPVASPGLSWCATHAPRVFNNQGRRT